MQRAAFERELAKYPKVRSDKFDAFIESWERPVSPSRSPAAAPALAARTAAPQADLDFWQQLREVLVQAAGPNAAKVQAEFEKVSQQVCVRMCRPTDSSAALRMGQNLEPGGHERLVG